MAAGCEAEVGGDGLADVGEADEADGAGRQAHDQHRHPLAGMVGAAECRVVAVVGGEDQEVARAEARENFGQPSRAWPQRVSKST